MRLLEKVSNIVGREAAQAVFDAMRDEFCEALADDLEDAEAIDEADVRRAFDRVTAP